jgi:hypothetical protein
VLVAAASFARPSLSDAVLLDEYEVDRLIGDLCRSINHEEGGLAVQAQLNDLCNRIEYAQQTGDGELEML